ncbi:hypothetical protein [Stenotrophomonas sp. NY11291]|uniref:hypothetical protein n=1 Tax=Stenotrophomonas sp. NY11291 TaxID=2939415 RepID=UPI00200ED0A9|nr:hypothetical protein [Stenotrophomonas sp. NY11291]UQA20576.1 hypothetical protein M1L61_12315 [Stenotrophomonas sp. NY11291]
MSLPFPDLPPIDIRRAYLAWCAPSPWLLALVLASTSAWMLASANPAPPLLAGACAAALVWFRSEGPGHSARAGTLASASLIGLAAWSASAADVSLMPAGMAAVLVAALLALRLRAVVRMARRLQDRVDATGMQSRWSKLPAAVSTLLAQHLRATTTLAPALQHTLVLATLAWAAHEEAQTLERPR